ncbi:TRAP transporter substrate-binding protein [Cryobacterium sp. N22]|uniref:TRAP transporter substrate-binding protein n=1 Tax=Cryobacterium sp. N22 TaxID=2048290 RepID=UPI000CE34FCD|nr:TRAP transporter substrate-binding protein [Cryobacterium sp. N22]
MRNTSRFFVAPTVGLLALSLVACGSSTAEGQAAGGETTTLQLALNQTEEHPSYISLDAFGDRLVKSTDGRFDIEVFPNEQLGAQADTLQLVSDGVVDMAIVSGAQLENLSKDFIAFNLPTVFDSVEHQMSVVNNPEITGDLYSSLAESNSVSVVGGLTQGARSIYTKTAPAETPADLAGQKIRVQESELFLALVEAIGASPTPMAFGEVYTALQSGVIDGAENNEVSYFTQKHHEVAPFFSYTNHLIGLDYLIINSNTLEGMSDEDRAAFDEEWTGTYEQHTTLWGEATDDAIAGATAAGATFTEVDSDAFTEALEPLVDQFLTEPSQKKLYDAAREASTK